MARIQEKNQQIATSIPFEEYIDDKLQDPSFAVEYLNTALDDEDPNVFIIALGDVARAYGMTEIAGRSRLGRESLYKSLSGRRNPKFNSIGSILDAVGMRLKVEIKNDAA
jgi:probable addiction module antidote protein